MTTRNFHIGDILSVTTGKLVSPRLIEGLYDILGFMAGEPLWTHQLPRVSNEAAPLLLEQHPQLAAVDASKVTAENWEAWLAEQVAHFGKELSVSPMSADQHERIDPVSELAEKVHPDRIIVVKAAE